jgi:hypothetical protein
MSNSSWRLGVRGAAGLLTLALVVGVLPDARAMFIRPDLEKIPVDRLVKNLEDLADKDTKNPQVRLNLARAHAMAYASKADEVEVWKGKTDRGPWFGFTPPHVPFQVVRTTDEAKLRLAREHLEKAIADYRKTIELDPNNLTARLGLAWCIDQSGNKAEAIKAYRDVIDAGWKKEMNLKSGPLGGRFITSEAGGYLIPLLDPEKDKEEIQTLKDRTAQLAKLPRPVTPIAIPLRDGLTASDLENPSARVLFDADGTGLPQRWSWITPQAGWLVWDPKGTGQVTSGLQLFGNVTFWMFWDNGYDALRALDNDGDGLLTGKELEGLAIWHDANGDGVCDPGEVKPLSYYGIVAISCRYERDPNHPERICWSPRGVVFKDGTTRPTFDLILKKR